MTIMELKDRRKFYRAGRSIQVGKGLKIWRQTRAQGQGALYRCQESWIGRHWAAIVVGRRGSWDY